MASLDIIRPADGSRIVQDDVETVLLGQPPEVLKGLLLKKIYSFDTLVLTDIKEKDGSLLNNLEFPLYFFLFVGNGLKGGRRLNLVGDADDISRALRILRLTLLGPTVNELDGWETPQAIKQEWLSASEFLALKDEAGKIRDVASFFNILPFDNGITATDHFKIEHLDIDSYKVSSMSNSVLVNLNEDSEINPPYQMQSDFVPRDLVKLGLEILGSASGFTADEPCTGLALCYSGDYILIDSLPYLDKHLFARGISKNQISAVFLTHLHDDHCALFPLILMPKKVDIISTKEIYTMAMDKLGCHLNWEVDVIKGYFNFIEVIPGETTNYYGLDITPHLTVHSIPTIGATFSTSYKSINKKVCVIGDNHSMSSIKKMAEDKIVTQETYENLLSIYTERFDLLVADGGAGAIHGEPADALSSDSDRVVFVHVEHLSNKFNTTFSLASSGKRYTILDGDSGIYTSLMNHYLSRWLGEPLSNRWARGILAEEEVRRYNAGDVIMVQESRTRGYVFLILTGYCEVVTYDGEKLNTLAQLQAGEVIGEMAVVTGTRKRNASVVASSPVTVCVFSEETFNAFITSEGYREKLLTRWALRIQAKQLPQFSQLISTVLERIAIIFQLETIEAETNFTASEDYWYLFSEGEAIFNDAAVLIGDEFGCSPFAESRTGEIKAISSCTMLRASKQEVETIISAIPQLNYLLRKYRIDHEEKPVEWLLGAVETH